VRATRHYKGMNLRNRLMHEDIPCGINLTHFDIMIARENRLAKKFKVTIVNENFLTI